MIVYNIYIIFLKDKILPLLSFYVYFSLEFQTVCLDFWGLF